MLRVDEPNGEITIMAMKSILDPGLVTIFL